MYAVDEALKRVHWGFRPQVFVRSVIGVVLCASPLAAGDPVAIAPDPPVRSTPRIASPAAFRPIEDLDGVYLWLGPVGAASHLDATWDSTFGVEATLTRIREHEDLALVGASLGASQWTARDGTRIWLDGVVGTRLGGRMVGASLGPIVELADLAHPRYGGSIGVWGYAGIAPFVRVGAVTDLGMFAELGVHLALPVLRR